MVIESHAPREDFSLLRLAFLLFEVLRTRALFDPPPLLRSTFLPRSPRGFRQAVDGTTDFFPPTPFAPLLPFETHLLLYGKLLHESLRIRLFDQVRYVPFFFSGFS